MNILFQNSVYYLWLRYVKKFDFRIQKDKMYDALNLTEPNTGNTIQQVPLAQIKAIHNKGGNEKEQYVRLHRT